MQQKYFRNWHIIFFSILLIACVQKPKGIVSNQADSFKVENVGNGIYVHHGEHLDIDTGYQGDICNVSFIVGNLGVAVIDTGGSLKVGNQLRQAIERVTDKPILFVVNTHVHPDHIFGNAAFVQANENNAKLQFVGHAKLPDAMELRREAYDKLNIKYLGIDAKGTEIVKPTLLVKEPIKIDLGGRMLTITPYPNAHTNTDITILDSKTDTLFTGDLLFIERTPVIEGDIKGLIAAIDVLKTYSVQQVVPGHGPVTRQWLQALNNQQRYLNTLLTDIRANIKTGKTMENAMDSAAESERNNWKLFEIANRRNVNTIYPTLEWE